MEKAQGEAAGAVGNAGQQHAPSTELDFAQLHFPLDDRLIARTKAADGHHSGAILVAQWQMEQQILQVGDPEVLEFFGHARSDPLERTDRDSLGLAGLRGAFRCRWVSVHLWSGQRVNVSAC